MIHNWPLTMSQRKKKSLDETNSYSTRLQLFTLKEINKTTTVGLQCLLHECITQNMFWVVCSRASCKIVSFVCTQAGEGEGGAKILQISWNIVVCNSLHLYFYQDDLYASFITVCKLRDVIYHTLTCFKRTPLFPQKVFYEALSLLGKTEAFGSNMLRYYK